MELRIIRVQMDTEPERFDQLLGVGGLEDVEERSKHRSLIEPLRNAQQPTARRTHSSNALASNIPDRL